MINFRKFKKYLKLLEKDIYGQPADAGHSQWALDSLTLMEGKSIEIKSVLDVGCGQGFMRPVFEGIGMSWSGCALGEDFEVMKGGNIPLVYHEDMSTLGFKDGQFDLIFARHVLEHSPFPLVTLMEWYRVSAKYLLLVVPSPEFWSYRGRNHYSVMVPEQLEWLLELSHWGIVKQYIFRTSDESFIRHGELSDVERAKNSAVEYRYFCCKV